jgi:hypothetical protein
MADNPSENSEEILKQKYPKLYEAVFGDGKKLSEQLILSSLFIMAFECLQDFVRGNFQDFFSDGYKTAKDGTVIPIEGKKFGELKEKYHEHYKALAKSLLNVSIERKNLFQSACGWFHEMQAFSDEDIKLIILATQIRNDLAHELYKWLLDDNVPHIEIGMVRGLLNLYFKISNWWICNIEADIMPEDCAKFSDDDMKSVASANVHILLAFLNKMFPEKT